MSFVTILFIYTINHGLVLFLIFVCVWWGGCKEAHVCLLRTDFCANAHRGS